MSDPLGNDDATMNACEKDVEIKRLRELRTAYDAKLKYIEELEKENDLLRDLLERVMGYTNPHFLSHDEYVKYQKLIVEARKALEGKE